MIAVLTYDIRHRKTQDLLLRLKACGHGNILVVALPFEKRLKHKPLYRHRPSNVVPIDTPELCDNLGYGFTRMSDLSFFKENIECVLIGGANIIEREQTERFKIINSHPGYLPHSRGLDALKWAIYHNWPIGVTTHIINEEIDGGFLIKQRQTNLYHNDSFHSIATRHYELEIEMLVDSLGEYDCAKVMGNKIVDEAGLWFESVVHGRMPNDLELVMMKRLEHRLMNIRI